MKKASYKELAKYLNVTVSTISGYPKKKRLLMLIGLYNLKHPKKNVIIDIDEDEIPFD